MKKLTLFMVLVCITALAGCSKDSEINSFITEFESVTKQMSEKIEAGDVDGAKKAFADNKASLESSWNSIKGARGFQVSEEMQKKLTESVTKNMSDLSSATIRGSMKLGGDKQKADDLKGLLEEYRNIFQM